MSVFAEATTKYALDDVTFPTSVDARAAQEAVSALRVLINASESVSVELCGIGCGQSVRIPPAAARLLTVILEETSRGHAVTVVPVHAELTTQEAADILNVSRPSFIQILDSGELPYRKVQKHRRVRAEDVLRYKRDLDARRHAVLDELAAYDQELGI